MFDDSSDEWVTLVSRERVMVWETSPSWSGPSCWRSWVFRWRVRPGWWADDRWSRYRSPQSGGSRNQRWEQGRGRDSDEGVWPYERIHRAGLILVLSSQTEQRGREWEKEGEREEATTALYLSTSIKMISKGCIGMALVNILSFLVLKIVTLLCLDEQESDVTDTCIEMIS